MEYMQRKWRPANDYYYLFIHIETALNSNTEDLQLSLCNSETTSLWNLWGLLCNWQLTAALQQDCNQYTMRVETQKVPEQSEDLLKPTDDTSSAIKKEWETSLYVQVLMWIYVIHASMGGKQCNIVGCGVKWDLFISKCAQKITQKSCMLRQRNVLRQHLLSLCFAELMNGQKGSMASGTLAE